MAACPLIHPVQSFLLPAMVDPARAYSLAVRIQSPGAFDASSLLAVDETGFCGRPLTASRHSGLWAARLGIGLDAKGGYATWPCLLGKEGRNAAPKYGEPGRLYGPVSSCPSNPCNLPCLAEHRPYYTAIYSITMLAAEHCMCEASTCRCIELLARYDSSLRSLLPPPILGKGN